MLLLMALYVNAQIQVEDSKPRTVHPTSTTVVATFDSTRNTSPTGRDKCTYIGREIFFLDDGGEFYRDSLLEKRIFLHPELKYYIVLDKVWFPGRTYYDNYRQDFVEVKYRYLYKLQEKGTDNVVFYDPELNNPLMPYEDAFSIFDVIWVSYYNYLKTEYIGKKYALTCNSISDYNTGEAIPYKYNEIWTVNDVKVIKDNGVKYRDSYVLRLILKNNLGNVIAVSNNSTLMVDKKIYDGYIKQYGSTMVKAAFEGGLKMGMHKTLVYHSIKQYLNAKGDNLSVSNTSKGEEWTIRSSSKTRYINFNTAGKVISWREEDPQTLRMTGKVSVSPR